MDVIDLHAFLTVFLFFVFLAIVAWVFASCNTKKYDEASKLPFELEKYQKDTDGK